MRVILHKTKICDTRMANTYLSLMHVEFSSHGFHLPGFFLNPPVVRNKLPCNLGSWLPRKSLPKLKDLFILFINSAISFHNLQW